MAEATSKVCAHCVADKDDYAHRSGGCCSACAPAQGYLPEHMTREDLEKLKLDYKFSLTRGFLGPKGCKLPREKRSYACIHYVCSKLVGAAILTDTWEQFRDAQKQHESTAYK